MFKLLKYLQGPAIIFAILAPLLMIIEVVMDLALPTLLSDLIDVGIANYDLDYVFTVGAQMLLFAFIGLLGGVGCGIFATLAGIRFGEKLREVLYEKIQTLAYAEIDQFKTSSLITRLTNDITQVQNMLMMALRILVRAPLMCIGGLIMATRLSPDLSMVFLVGIPIIIVVVSYILWTSFPLFKKMQEKIDQVNNVMRESLLGIRVIKAFTMEEKQAQRFDDVNEALKIQSVLAQKNMLGLNPLVTLVVNFSIVAVLWYGGHLSQNGLLENGRIMAFVNYLTQIMMSLLMVIRILTNFSRAKVSAERINEVLMVESIIQDPPTPQELLGYDIEFNDVSFKYHENSVPVLKNLSFKIKAGQRVGIIGGTGSGKTSLVQLIPRLYEATSGAIFIDGKNVNSLSLRDLRRDIGMVLQENILFSGTIASNIKFGHANASAEELNSAATDAQALEFINQKDERYETLVEQRGKNLSGGQKQRVSIARTLIRNPKILILDDSTSALDLETERLFHKALQKRTQNSTVILIAQRISSVREADQIIVLDEGQISGIGTHEELLMTNEIYRSIAISQLGEEALIDE